MLPGNSRFHLWLGPQKVTAVEASTPEGSVDSTGGFILFPLPRVPFFVQSLDAGFPGVLTRDKEVDPQG